MVPAVAAGLISAGSNIVDAFAQGMTNRANRKWSEKMYAKQRADSIADWNRQNEYNDPSQQMKRLKNAGLNPHLVYGTGIQAAGQSAPIRASTAPAGQGVAPKLNMGNAIAAYINLKQADASVELKNQQTLLTMIKGIVEAARGRNIDEDTRLKGSQIGLNEVSKETKDFDLGLKRELRNVSVQAANQSLQKMIADTQFTIDANTRANALQAPTITKMIAETALIRINTVKSRAEIDEIKQRVRVLLQDERLKKLDADLKQSGQQPGDWIWWRKLDNFLNGIGVPTNQEIDDLLDPDNVNANTTSGVSR